MIISNVNYYGLLHLQASTCIEEERRKEEERRNCLHFLFRTFTVMIHKIDIYKAFDEITKAIENDANHVQTINKG